MTIPVSQLAQRDFTSGHKTVLAWLVRKVALNALLRIIVQVVIPSGSTMLAKLDVKSAPRIAECVLQG